ncbi:MAG TPA: YraN family protein [Thermohalobaculum sp.]|nr:YraN family protein [Thermohalobaculum sp.]
MSRQVRGRRALRAGAAAEDAAARRYEAMGGRVLARRWRAPEGELDLVVLQGGVLVFVEVKLRRVLHGDDPVGEAQWRRLEAAASRYMMGHGELTGAARGCRFDLALAGPDGSLEVIENARMFG